MAHISRMRMLCFTSLHDVAPHRTQLSAHIIASCYAMPRFRGALIRLVALHCTSLRLATLITPRCTQLRRASLRVLTLCRAPLLLAALCCVRDLQIPGVLHTARDSAISDLIVALGVDIYRILTNFICPRRVVCDHECDGDDILGKTVCIVLSNRYREFILISA